MIDITAQEVFKLLNYIQQDKQHSAKGLFLKLQYIYARRSDEIATLKVNDIDFNNGCIKFNIAKKRTKETPTINLVLMPELSDDLQKIIADNNLTDNDYIFISDISKKDGFKRNLRSYLERNICKLTGTVLNKPLNLGTHDFRRLRGQHLLSDGIGLEVLQKLYQHEDVSTTMIYLQVEESEISNVLINDINRKYIKGDYS